MEYSVCSFLRILVKVFKKIIMIILPPCPWSLKRALRSSLRQKSPSSLHSAAAPSLHPVSTHKQTNSYNKTHTQRIHHNLTADRTKGKRISMIMYTWTWNVMIWSFSKSNQIPDLIFHIISIYISIKYKWKMKLFAALSSWPQPLGSIKCWLNVCC